jgi:hypothetical protein
MKAQESFQHDPEVQVLIATDAAGEGVNAGAKVHQQAGVKMHQ